MDPPDEEYPYHVIAIGELTKHYSPENFRYAIGVCRDVVAKTIAEDNRSDQQRARYRILRLLDLQLLRAVRWVEEEADLMAWVMRNLIELKFWAKFVSESEEKATQFLNEADIDMKELYESLEKLLPAGTPRPVLPPVTGRRVRVETSGDREALMWKNACKLIHPSSYVINHFEETVRNGDNNQIFAIQILEYGWGIVTTFHEIDWKA
ncbi:MAG: hypothetical protein ACLQGV_08700 [Bryobacteraceae bacterium]